MTLRQLFRRLLGRSRFDRDLTDELRDHLDRRTEDLVRGGLSPDDARRRARVEFGALEAYKDQVRDTRRAAWIARLPDQLWRELRLSLRRLRATPIFTLLAISSLAIGVGVTASVHAVIVSILWQPLGIPDADHLLAITLTEPRTRTVTWEGVIARADFDDLRAADLGLGEPAASAGFSQALTSQDIAAVASGEIVTGNYFSTVGVGPHLGRLIGVSDDQPGAPPVVVLSHRLWRRVFASDPAVVGRAVRVGGVPFEVIGVAAESFNGLKAGPRILDRMTPGLFVPLSSASRFPSRASGLATRTERNRRVLTVIVRPRGDRDLNDVSTALAALGARLDAAFPMPARPAARFVTEPDTRAWALGNFAEFDARVRADAWQTGGFFVVIVGLVLAVACTNLANLVFARGASREHELAVRSALGASRGRLIREQMVESAVLASAGALGAYCVMRGFVVWLTGASLPVGQGRFLPIEPAISPAVLCAAGGAVVLSLCVFGLLPALQLTRRDHRPALAGDAGAGSLRWSGRARLISWQVGTSTAFLLVAAFCARVIISNSTHDSGVNMERLAVGAIDFWREPWNETRARRALDDFVSLAKSEGRIEALAVSSGLPIGTVGSPVMAVTTPDRPFAADRSMLDGTIAPSIAATPGLFSTIGVPIVSGRAFDDRDGAGAPAVVVLSRRTALQLFGTTEAVGRDVVVRDLMGPDRDQAPERLSVIGIAGDTDIDGSFLRTVGAPAHARRYGAIYRPLAQRYTPLLTVTARTSGDPAGLAGVLKTLAWRAAPDLVLENVGSASAVLESGLLVAKVVGLFAAALAALSLFLSMTGLYGVLAQLVSRRMREMGVRLALGADRGHIGRLVLGDGLRPVVRGVLAGIGLGALVRLVLQSQFAAPPSSLDLTVFVLAPIPLIGAAVMACYLPARRASRVDPNVALRDL